MKTNIFNQLSLSLLIIFFAVNAFSQSLKTVKIADISIYQGVQDHSFNALNIAELRMLAPNSEFLKNDFTGFSSAWFYGFPTNTNSVSLNIGFKFSDCDKMEYKSNPRLNIGLVYNNSTLLSSSFSKNEMVRFDTLSSAISGDVVYKDSVYTQTYRTKYFYEQIGINANLVFRYNPEGRWSLYSGVGLNAAFSINSGTLIQFSETSRVQYVYSAQSTSYPFYNFPGSSSDVESHKNKMNVFAMVYVPLGVDFRISKQNSFWNKIHLVMEMQPGMAVYNIPEIGGSITGAFKGNFGIKVEI